MKTTIYKRLQEKGYDVHRCAPGSDRNCYYLISKGRDRDYGENDGCIFKAVRETSTGELVVGANLDFFVTKSAQATARAKGLMGDFDSYVQKAGIHHLRELLLDDLSVSPKRKILLNSESPDEAFVLPAGPDPLAEQRDLRLKILHVLAEKHSAGSKRVSKDDLLEDLCTNIAWVDRALVILSEQKLLDGALRGNMKLLPAGYLEAEKTIAQSQPGFESTTGLAQNDGAATAVMPMTDEIDGASSHAFDIFVSYASEDQSAIRDIVASLEAREITVWWDKGQITLGDKLSEKIDEGLRNSRYGVVIISSSFIAKRWPESELRSMISRSTSSGEKVILPVLLGLSHADFSEQYPFIADTVTTQFDGDVDQLVTEISTAIGRPSSGSPQGAPKEFAFATAYSDSQQIGHPHGARVSSFLNDNDLLARLVPYGEVPNASDVIWTNRPQAFIRLVPTEPIGPLTPRKVHGLIFSPPFALPLFGIQASSWFEPNEFGAVAFDAQPIGQISASRIVQVFESGEIWAIDADILSRGEDDQRGIPSIAIEKNFIRALSNYSAFAKNHLGLALPLRLIAGLDGVMGYSMAVRHGLAGNVVKDSIVHESLIESYDTPPYESLFPLFNLIWEYAGLDRPDDLHGA